MLWLLFQYCWMCSALAACKQSLSGNDSILCWVYFGYFSNSTRGGIWRWRGWGGGTLNWSGSPSSVFLNITSIRNTCLVYQIGICFAVACTNVHSAVPSRCSPLLRSSPPFSLLSPCLLFSLPFCQVPFPFRHFPLLSGLGLHHLLSWMHLRHSSHATTSDLLKDPGRRWGGGGLSVFCNEPSSIKRRMNSKEERVQNRGID